MLSKKTEPIAPDQLTIPINDFRGIDSAPVEVDVQRETAAWGGRARGLSTAILYSSCTLARVPISRNDFMPDTRFPLQTRKRVRVPTRPLHRRVFQIISINPTRDEVVKIFSRGAAQREPRAIDYLENENVFAR